MLKGLIVALILGGLAGLVIRSKKGKEKLEIQSAMQQAEKRNEKGVLRFIAPSSEKMEGISDEHFGELQISQHARIHVLIIMGFVFAIFVLGIYSAYTGGIVYDEKIVLTLAKIYVPYVALYVAFCFLYYKRTYINYYATGMVHSNFFKENRVEYNSIVKITESNTYTAGSANSVESFDIYLNDSKKIVISGMVYKFTHWHVTTLMDNVYIDGEKTNLV